MENTLIDAGRESGANYSGLVFFDADYRIKYRSPIAEQLTGWRTEDLNDIPFGDTVHPDDLTEVMAILYEVRHTPRLSLTYAFRSKHHSGHHIWLQSTYTNMLDQPGLEAIICTFTDISAQKKTEDDYLTQTKQVNNVLQTMNDGFLTLDENLCYTYVNSRLLKLAHKTEEELMGKFIWDVFPDLVGSASWQAIDTALRDKKHVTYEDFYAPLQLWQENHVYPSGKGLSIFVRDITRQKTEEQHHKFLESVITNTNDAIMITEAEPIVKPGPRILYVNEAFTRMTGYSIGEVIGKTPRILQGPKTDKQELHRIKGCLRNWQPCETTVINYKKNGEEFWLNFVLNPVANEKGWYTHWVSIERDVTKQKNDELLKTLLAEIGSIFNQPVTLTLLLDKLLEKLVTFGNFSLAEVWLIRADTSKMGLAASYRGSHQAAVFYLESGHVTSVAKGEGLPGKTWELQAVQFWEQLDERADFVRRDAAAKAGLKLGYGVPLFSENSVIGVLVLCMGEGQRQDMELMRAFEALSGYLGAGLRRKQLEQELDQVFTFAPVIVCTAGTDRYFKKVNPAMCHLLEYTEEELLGTGISNFVHVDDRAQSAAAFDGLQQDEILHWENRYITKSGKLKWLSWTATRGTEEGLLFCVGNDITENKELKALLSKASDLGQTDG